MLPVTFSAPGEAYEPSVEDCLRDGVWLMLMADDLNRKAYSYDDENPDAGVRISAELEQTDEDGRLVVPQQVVVVGFGSVKFQYDVSRGGKRTVTINVGLLEANTSDKIEIDTDAPQQTVLAKLARVEEILRRGTLWKADVPESDQVGRVVDPYNSELDDDGHYIEAGMRTLNDLAPEIVRAPPRAIPRKKLRTQQEIDGLDLVRDIAVLYGLSATYTIQMRDRNNMRTGGFANE